MNSSRSKTEREVVTLIPAAGKASRLGPLPCSKELYPVGFRTVESKKLSPKVVSHYLLETLRNANIKKAYFILRDNKWDIPSYYGDGTSLDMHFAYLMMDLPYGVPYTLDQAYPFIKDNVVALGFPDMIIEPENVFVQLLEEQSKTNADLVLGLFPAMKSHKTDMVELDEKEQVVSIHIKPDDTHLDYAWETAVWTPVFSRFMHEYVSGRKKIHMSSENTDDEKRENELHVGDVLQAAIDQGMKTSSVLFKQGSCLDIGTSEDLQQAIQDNAP